jgi:hypothetical protein
MPRTLHISLIACALAPFLALAQPRLGLYIVSPVAFGTTVRAQMDQELQAIFAPTGLQIHKRTLQEPDAAEVFDRVIVMKFKGACDYRSLPMWKAGNSLGVTHTADAKILPFVEVDCDLVLRTLRTGVELRSYQLTPTEFANALARVAAHELYHALAHTRQHSDAGITKAALSAKELLAPRLELPQDSVRMIQNMLAHRSGTEVAAAVAATGQE